MALFFDRLWFDAILAERGFTRETFASLSGITAPDLALMVKDQMEISPALVRKWSDLLRIDAGEIVRRCGISTPMQHMLSDTERISELEARVAALEAQIQTLLKQPSAKS